ncbi:hypothetical protein HPY86_05510 [candidate division WOR-3 bacterium]|nr:hypothetical protein [candidate division WOR-3 bacterium]
MRLFDILNWHIRHYPLLQAEDIYKLIFQGVFGPSHLLNDQQKERENLNREVALASTFKIRVESEPVDPDGLLIRVNLASLAGSAAKTEQLFQALIETARTFKPRPEILPSRIDTALKWCLCTLPREAPRLNLIAAKPQHPPQHSATYLQNYRPAYRVVLSRLWFPV